MITNTLKEALDADPANWENRYALVEAYVSAGQKNEAILLMNEVTVLPEDAASLIAAGRCYERVGAASDGQGIIQAVVDAAPDNAEAHFALAEVAHVAGDEATARKSFIIAHALNPKLKNAELSAAYGADLPAVAVVALAETESAPVAVKVVESAPLQPPTAVEAASPSGSVPKKGAQTVTLQDVEDVKSKETLDSLADKSKTASEDSDSGTVTKTIFAGPVPTLSIQTTGEVDPELEEEIQHISDSKKASALTRLKTMQRDKLISLAMTILVHLAILTPLALVVTHIPRDVPPSLVATAVATPEEEVIDNVNVERTKITNKSAAASVTNVVSVAGVSNFSVPNIAIQGDISMPTQNVAFAPSMDFAPATTSMDSVMMFGEPIEGEVLGVILDVSGSMAEYLPMVVREVDKNYKNAPIVYINHAQIVGKADATRIYPIVEKEVIPYWPKEWEKGNSPYWFLWHDLPRKAPQRSVDRLIKTFKTRKNSFIARGGNNRISAAADFLSDQDCDSLYIFSDFEDFVDEDLALKVGQRLGRRKIKTYVQPASEESEHLTVVHNKIARRTLGRKLKPLSDILRPKDDTEKPIAVHVEKPTPVPEGVKHATRRPGRTDIDKNFYYHGNGFYKDEIKVFEYEMFDIALHGPQARAYIYLKDKDGYLQRPVIFGYHSAKYTMGTDNRLHWRHRKFIKNIEEPKLEGNQFTWNMLLEDDLEFKVVFWFKEDTATATYVAEKPQEGERDDARIYFIMPPLAREKKDLYYGPDYPAEGLTLDNVRVAVSDNRATFHLPGAAADRLGKSWKQLGFKRGHNVTPYNVLYRTLPSGVREVTVQGPSFADLQLHARTTSNKLLLHARGFRADMELWEGFVCLLIKPEDDRDRFTKTEAIEFSVTRGK